MSEFLGIPLNWFGTVPQWMMLIVLVIIAFKPPELFKIWSANAAARHDRVGRRISELEAAVIQCRADCDRETRELHQQLLNRDHQRIQEQISLISIIMQSVDNPLLKRMLDQMQSIQRTLPTELPGVAGDTEGAKNEGAWNNEGE